MNKKLSRLQLLNEFESAPTSALFNQHTLAAVLDCSTQLLERNRWEGKGVPILKLAVRFCIEKVLCCLFSNNRKSIALLVTEVNCFHWSTNKSHRRNRLFTDG